MTIATTSLAAYDAMMANDDGHRAAKILVCLNAHAGLTMDEVSHETGIDPFNVRPLLCNMKKFGLVRWGRKSDRTRSGRKAFENHVTHEVAEFLNECRPDELKSWATAIYLDAQASYRAEQKSE